VESGKQKWNPDGFGRVFTMNEARANVFDAVNAAALCGASAEAYSEGGDISCASTDTHARITESERDVIVAFRGTTDLRNWLTDLDCAWDLEDGCRVHRGFARALDSVQGQITEEICARREEGRRIWLTGHSLGGALAMLYAWRFFNARIEAPFAGIYTFGQPRVGNAAFRDIYNLTQKLYRGTFRVVHGDDVVPRVPWLLGEYRHAGHEVFFANVVGGRFSQGSTESHPTGTDNQGSKLAQYTGGPLCGLNRKQKIEDGSREKNYCTEGNEGNEDKEGKRCGPRCCAAEDGVGAPTPHLVDPGFLRKVRWDVRCGWREFCGGKVALLADHHVNTYLELFRGFLRGSDETSSPLPSPPQVCGGEGDEGRRMCFPQSTAQRIVSGDEGGALREPAPLREREAQLPAGLGRQPRGEDVFGGKSEQTRAAPLAVLPNTAVETTALPMNFAKAEAEEVGG
jgi:hypothetical protein